MKRKLLLSLVLLFSMAGIHANNLRVTGGTQVSESEVSFSISWENSWNVQGKPANHDAIWLFIKYRECGGSGPWKHALLSTNMLDHKFDGRITAATPVSLSDRFGNLPAGATETNGLGNNTGIMIKRSSIGKGDISSATCTLKVVQAVGVPFPSGLDYEIKVIGIEMVWVNTGEYILGDAHSGDSYNQVTIASEDAVSAAALGPYQDALPAAFPKGYQGFYCMKYEITQGQYYDLITTGGNLTIRSPAYFTGNYRNTLSTTGVTAPDRVQNYISWEGLKAYLDWSCLRPMTELEYEKACRGVGSFDFYGYAWGTDKYTRILYVSGPEDGTEIGTEFANCHVYEASTSDFLWPPNGPPDATLASDPSGGGYYFSATTTNNCLSSKPTYTATGGDRSFYYTPIYMCGSDLSQGWGPVGAGIFARDDNETRVSSGATYYGIMEMSGNVWEQCIMTRYSTNTNFTGVWGNGYLVNGKSDVSDWFSDNYIGLRGGSFLDRADRMRVCDRNRIANPYRVYTDGVDATYTIGGRGVR